MGRPQTREREIAAIESFIRERMDRLRVPGVAVGVQHAGVEYAAGFGVTNIEHPLAVNADTLFPLGSVTKSFTATAVLRLVEAGRLALDDPVRAYLPDLRLADEAAAARVTLQHLLTHTAGWEGDAVGDFGAGDDALARQTAHLANVPQLTPPGRVWAYNNGAYCLAGRLLEVATGQPYEAAVRELVLEPLGMAWSCWVADEAITHRVAAGHTVDPVAAGPPAVARPWAYPRAWHPAGGLITTVRDTLRFVRFHLGDGAAPDGTRLLAPATLALMRSPLVPDALHNGCLGSFADAAGLGWFVRDVAGVRIATHGGTPRGQSARVTLVPGRGFGIAVLANADTGARLHAEVTAWALERFLGVAGLEPVPIPAAAARLAPYAGRYRLWSGQEVELALVGDALHLFTPPSVFRLYADDRVVVTDGRWKGERGQFLRGADGAITWFRLGGRLCPRLA